MNLLLATILPSLLIIFVFVSSDKFREPAKEIIKVFFYGILITIPAYYLNTYLGDVWYATNASEELISSFLTAAPVEESLKLAVLYFLVYKMKDFNEPVDGIVYGVTVSLGFATLENIYYVYLLADYYETSSMAMAIGRSFSAVPAHAVFGVFMGYFFMNYSFIKKGDNLLVLISWIVALRMFSRLKKTQRRKRREYEKKI